MRAFVVSVILALVFAFAFQNPAQAQNTCGHPHGDHVVIDVRFDDSIGGLAVRSSPNAGANRLGIIPAAGTGVGVGD